MHKKYKRFRMKWFIAFLLIGALIVWKGYSHKVCERLTIESEMQGEKGEEVRDDYQYLKESPDIRVVLQAGDYDGIYHEKFTVCFPQGGYVLVSDAKQWVKHSIDAGKIIQIGIGEACDFSINQEQLIVLVPAGEDAQLAVSSIQRNREQCSYYGRVELTLEKAGMVAVNVIPLEKYLCGVVPSEMPASYGKEALKAQAILARTYAYKYLIEPGYPEFGAHVDDSINYQVYGNIENNLTTDQAVADTEGILLFYDRSLAEVYYYSTSCGYGTDGSAWGEEGAFYLQGLRIGPGELQNEDGTLKGLAAEEYYLQKLQEEDCFRNMIKRPFVNGYEEDEPWYRWYALDVEISSKEILKRLKERYEANPNIVLTQNKSGEFESKTIKKLGDIKEIYIEERGIGGCIKSLIIEGSEATYKIMLEYNIRYVLNGNGITVTRVDGTTAYCKMLLPSGFFFLDTVQDGKNVISYSIYGGGYGHGVGMSQNGANRMADAGFTYDEILQKFFPETIFVSYENNA